jgi:anti-sigma B factor antagonist
MGTVRSTNLVGVPVLHTTGELDVYGITGAREELIDLIECQAHRVIVADMTGVTFVDSAALGVLVGACKRLREQGGRLSLVVDGEAVLRTLRVSSLIRLFDVFNDLDSALSAAITALKTRTRRLDELSSLAR